MPWRSPPTTCQAFVESDCAHVNEGATTRSTQARHEARDMVSWPCLWEWGVQAISVAGVGGAGERGEELQLQGSAGEGYRGGEGSGERGQGIGTAEGRNGWGERRVTDC